MAGLFSAPIDVAASGDKVLVAAVVGSRIVVLAYLLLAGGAVNVKFVKPVQEGEELTVTGVITWRKWPIGPSRR